MKVALMKEDLMLGVCTGNNIIVAEKQDLITEKRDELTEISGKAFTILPESQEIDY